MCVHRRGWATTDREEEEELWGGERGREDGTGLAGPHGEAWWGPPGRRATAPGRLLAILALNRHCHRCTTLATRLQLLPL